MSSLVRASAVGVVALALVVPSGATAAAKKPKHTVTVNQVDVLPKTTSKNLNRKCGKSKSATKIRKRSTSRPTKNRVRTVTYYCSGGTRTQLWIKKLTKTVTVPGPVVTVPAAAGARRPAPKGFRLTLLHNNDGESKYGVGDSIVGYGGVTRFKTVLDRLRGEADALNAARAGERQGHGHDQLGRQLPRRPEPAASFQRFDAGQGPFYDSIALDRHRLRRDHDRQPRVRLRARRAWQQLIEAPSERRAVPDRQHRLRRGAAACRRCATAAGSPTRPSSQGRPADRHHRRHHAGRAQHLLAGPEREVPHRRRGDRQRRGRAPDRGGREQDHPVARTCRTSTPRRR